MSEQDHRRSTNDGASPGTQHDVSRQKESNSKGEGGYFQGCSNACGCTFMIFIVLGLAMYIAWTRPELIQEFLSWIDGLQ